VIPARAKIRPPRVPELARPTIRRRTVVLIALAVIVLFAGGGGLIWFAFLKPAKLPGRWRFEPGDSLFRDVQMVVVLQEDRTGELRLFDPRTQTVDRSPLAYRVIEDHVGVMLANSTSELMYRVTIRGNRLRAVLVDTAGNPTGLEFNFRKIGDE
jgi:hypothetical protein